MSQSNQVALTEYNRLSGLKTKLFFKVLKDKKSKITVPAEMLLVLVLLLLLSHFSPIQLSATPWTAAYQAPPSMGFSTQVFQVLEWVAMAFSDQQKWCHIKAHFLVCMWLPSCCGFLRWLSDKEYACQCRRQGRCRFNPWVRKTRWRRKRQPSPVLLLGKSHGQRGTWWVGYSPQDCKQSDTTEQLNTHMRPPTVSSHDGKQTKRNRQRQRLGGARSFLFW